MPRFIVVTASEWMFLFEVTVCLEKLEVPPNKKATLPLPGNPASSLKPVAFRSRLATGLAFSKFIGKLTQFRYIFKLIFIIFKNI